MKRNQVSKRAEDLGNIYIGIDVHKKSWEISILGDSLELKSFSQPPEPGLLVNYLKRNFPDMNYYSAYESGFSGFWAHRELERLGINNIVVNPADVPTTNKEKKQKRDSVDCRKIARSLRNNELQGIYVPDEQIDRDKALVRLRQKLLRDVKRCKNRIKSNLLYRGESIPEHLDSSYWSKGFRSWLRTLSREYDTAGVCLKIQLDELEAIEEQKKRVEKELVTLSNTRYADLCKLLRSIPGIGLLGAVTLITEIKDIHRFSNLDRLHSFVGLIPNVNSSGDRESIGSITQRHNHFVRPILVQCAWVAARQDPGLFRYYNKLCRRMKASKAIIRVAKKLLNRVSYVWKNGCEYEIRDTPTIQAS